MEPIDIIQKSRAANQLLNTFDKSMFVNLVHQMDSRQFETFCKTILLLHEYHDTTVGLHATDKVEQTFGKEDYFWQLNAIDPNRDINFVKVS